MLPGPWALSTVSAAAPGRPWDPSLPASSFQLPAAQHALVRSGRIKNRSVVQDRVNKWQMLCISRWPVTTAGVKGPTDCCHMKSGILAVRRRSASHSALELGRLASAHYNVNRLAQTGVEQFLCLTHTSLAEASHDIKQRLVPLSQRAIVFYQYFKVWLRRI